jgi:hypothetical protein
MFTRRAFSYWERAFCSKINQLPILGGRMRFLLSLCVFVAVLAVPFANVLASGEALTYDPQNYDPALGCYDSESQTYRRIQLTSASEIQQRINSKNFECTELSDVILDGKSNGNTYLKLGDFKEFKVVGIEGVGGSLGNAGVFDINFRGAKITNLFLEYQVPIGGDTSGLIANGIYLAFYSRFVSSPGTGNCRQASPSERSPVPSYATISGGNLAVRAFGRVTNKTESRLFSLNSSRICQ